MFEFVLAAFIMLFVLRYVVPIFKKPMISKQNAAMLMVFTCLITQLVYIDLIARSR